MKEQRFMIEEIPALLWGWIRKSYIYLFMEKCLARKRWKILWKCRQSDESRDDTGICRPFPHFLIIKLSNSREIKGNVLMVEDGTSLCGG